MTTATTTDATGTRRVVALCPDGTQHDFHLTISGKAEVGDVVDALADKTGQEWPPTLFVNGQGFPTSMALADVPIDDGSVLAASPAHQPTQEALLEFLAVSGDNAGSTVRYAAGRFALGSRRLVATLEVDGSGTAELVPDPNRGIRVSGRMHHHRTSIVVGDVIEIDGTAYSVAPAPRRTPSRARPEFNRPPRTLPPDDPAPLVPPSRDQISKQSVTFRWPMLLGPVVMGVAMMVIFQRMAFLIFIAVGPLMLLANFVDGKMRNRKGSRRAEAAFRRALKDFGPALDTWRGTLHDVARRRHPSLPRTIQRAVLGDDRLWERRPHHVDFMKLFIGYGPTPLAPAVSHAAVEPEVAAILAQPDRRGSFPIEIDFSAGSVVGLTGPPEVSRGLARSLMLQAAIHHGPADLAIAVVCQPSCADAWKFAGWLPHAESDQGRQLLAATTEDAGSVFAELKASDRPALLVFDGEYTPERAGLVATLASEHPVSVLVIADSVSGLPGITSTSIEVRPGASLAVTEPATGRTVGSITGTLMSEGVAREAARSLARITDPERMTVGGSLPGRVDLLELLGLSNPTAAEIAASWSASGETIKAPIGRTASGVLEVDLVRDGPHGLLGGTTGSGKSELLRSMVASLAARVDPEHLNFVLIDYKGGSAFDVCSELPHVVGLVTDLDPSLATRAVTCLEAELEYREHRLRDAGASDLPGYLKLGLKDPLPRLFIVIDEFAAMSKEMPEFMAALVDIAARGRSLGVHLLLATQRPAGVIGENIRANTNLRMALRVQSTSDSKDVLGDDAASGLPRSIPGRGYVRFGPSELVAFQAALVTGASGFVESSVEVHDVRFDPQGPSATARTIPDGVKTDLERLVDAIKEAAVAANMEPGHTPWPPALTPDLSLHTLLPSDDVTLGLADEPAKQRQTAFAWNPSGSALGLYGIPGTGPEAAVETAIRSIAARFTQSQAHVFIMKFGTHTFDQIATLPHVATPVDADDQERQFQLLRMIRREFDQRRKQPAVVAERPQLFVVIDDAGAFRDAYDSFHLNDYLNVVGDVIAKGAPLGIHLIATMNRPNALPMKMASMIVDRLVFQFADMTQAMALGLKRNAIVDELPFGGFIDVGSGLLGQVAVLHDGVPIREDDGAEGPSVPVLPTSVFRADLPPAALSPDRLWLPVGIGETDLTAAGVSLEEGDHLLITSPMRGGRSSLLAAMACQLADGSDSQLVAIVPRKSPLTGLGCFKYVVTDLDRVDALAAALADSGDEPIVVFVDDAEMVQSQGMERLLSSRKSNVRILAAMRNEDATRSYSHWTKRVKDCRKGVAIQPVVGIAEMYGHQFPKATMPYPQGRGFVIDGHTVEKVQIAEWQSASEEFRI